MYGYDDQEEHLDSIGQSCKHLRSRNAYKSSDPGEGLSCSICSSWDGTACTRKAYDPIRTKLELD